LVDTSILVPSYNTSSTVPASSFSPSSTIPEVGTTEAVPARIESLTCDDQQLTIGRVTTCRAEVSGDVDWVGWYSYANSTTPSTAPSKSWSRDQAEISLKDALVQQLGFGKEGDHEVLLQVCTGADPWAPRSICVEDTAAVWVGPETLADKMRANWGGGCEGEGSEMLTVAPIAPDQLDYIIPLGSVNGGHPTPVSHQYWNPRMDVLAEVRSPTGGNIVSLFNRGLAVTEGSYGGATGQDYEVQYVIEVSCDFFLILDHVLDVPERIRAALGNRLGLTTRIPVLPGEVLGHHPDGHKVDFAIVDIARGEVDGLYDGEVFKFFQRDSFEYFDEPLRSSLEEMSLQVLAPRGGTFLYNVNGTAQGSWFQEDTNGYAGNPDSLTSSYFAGHMSLVSDNIDSSQLRVAIGDGFEGHETARVWGVTGDTPRFDTVTPATGPVTYELREVLPCDGSSFDDAIGRAKVILCNFGTRGTLLIEVLDDQSMRVEAFLSGSPVSGPAFTENARVYVRLGRPASEIR
jgi:hypothetical protein